MRSRFNPWKRFPAKGGEALLRWVAAGNVGLIVHDPAEKRLTYTQRGYTLWAQTLPLLDEALLAIGIRRYPMTPVVRDPYPHIEIRGMPLERALVRAQHKPPPDLR